ncbi:hypothetical protein D3C85_1460000 [compost metagenome]
MQRFAGADVVPKSLDHILQRAAMGESAPPAAPHRFMGEDTPAAVVVDKPDLAAGIDFHAGVAVHSLTEKEPTSVVGDDPDCLVDVLDALALQGEFVFCGHGASYAGACPGGGGMGQLQLSNPPKGVRHEVLNLW